ncbi:hypothetical protein TREMEDRAFT_61007 [Tremella mesenterica DSM 1558]|uniref:uncharacterized protein n=1 Tax=Tremella mesenterica (strain ATCC 24925 / CBS 8224 / DSM 1558 / NBRC 9311 / NRRL Y-6157 / RJB 2259-6 / UBC 559-6) TaxID=578456 RepID=UPI0003F49EF7|nr:uncharacterized protein TREMEDRAFT_61007 [Tremella mesenterica DSM 1558]EIW70503.1 hypothetical protein TREMEDRAFT_61007 [Tremella mesenterica DSM 1558]
MSSSNTGEINPITMTIPEYVNSIRQLIALAAQYQREVMRTPEIARALFTIPTQMLMIDSQLYTNFQESSQELQHTITEVNKWCDERSASGTDLFERDAEGIIISSVIPQIQASLTHFNTTLQQRYRAYQRSKLQALEAAATTVDRLITVFDSTNLNEEGETEDGETLG